MKKHSLLLLSCLFALLFVSLPSLAEETTTSDLQNNTKQKQKVKQESYTPGNYKYKQFKSIQLAQEPNFESVPQGDLYGDPQFMQHQDPLYMPEEPPVRIDQGKPDKAKKKQKLKNNKADKEEAQNKKIE